MKPQAVVILATPAQDCPLLVDIHHPRAMFLQRLVHLLRDLGGANPSAIQQVLLDIIYHICRSMNVP